jgi:hypothetical protein
VAASNKNCLIMLQEMVTKQNLPLQELVKKLEGWPIARWMAKLAVGRKQFKKENYEIHSIDYPDYSNVLSLYLCYSNVYHFVFHYLV